VGSLAPVSTFAPEQVPEELKHRVSLRVLFEAWQDGRVTESAVFERSWPGADAPPAPRRGRAARRRARREMTGPLLHRAVDASGEAGAERGERLVDLLRGVEDAG
jgi:hypothetical protein